MKVKFLEVFLAWYFLGMPLAFAQLFARYNNYHNNNRVYPVQRQALPTYVPPHSPPVYAPASQHPDFFAHPNYKFHYNVHAPQTGDFKLRREERVMGALRGEYAYSTRDPSGSWTHMRFSASYPYNPKSQQKNKVAKRRAAASGPVGFIVDPVPIRVGPGRPLPKSVTNTNFGFNIAPITSLST